MKPVNEFQAQDELSELEALRQIKLDFAVASVQPFITSAQQDVINPDWHKLQLPVRQSGSGDSLSTGSLRAITMLNGLLTYVDIQGTPAGLV
jgi:hypothetical protein